VVARGGSEHAAGSGAAGKKFVLVGSESVGSRQLVGSGDDNIVGDEWLRGIHFWREIL